MWCTRASAEVQDCEMAAPLLPSTPCTTEALGDHHQRAPVSPSRLASMRKAVEDNLHTYHDVVHTVQHRAQEKIGFGVANMLLARLGETLASHMTVPVATVVKHSSMHAKAMSRVRKWCAGVRDYLTRRPFLRNTTVVTHATTDGAHAAHHAVLSSPLNHVLFGLNVLLPILGVYLLSHMAEEGMHRAQEERRKPGARLTTFLFDLGAFCDALDAAAHVVIALCMIAHHADYHLCLDDHLCLDHHLEHELHSYSLYVALVACVAMMLGNALAAPHGHDYVDHAHGPTIAGTPTKEKVH